MNLLTWFDKFHDLHFKLTDSPPCNNLEEITKGVEEEPLKNFIIKVHEIKKFMKNFHFGHRDQGIKQIPSKLQSIVFSSFFKK